MKTVVPLLALMFMFLVSAIRPLQAVTPGSERVDTALVLAVDTSNSVDARRYLLQMEGIAKALEDKDVQNAILAGPNHSIFIALIQWSNKAHLSIPWTLITDEAGAQRFADKVRSLPRAEANFTCMSRSIQSVEDKVLPFLPVPANRIVIDVSGDGRDDCNPEKPMDLVRDGLVTRDITINGLPILEGDEADTLEVWYRDHVIGGPSAFLIPALGFEDFERAMRQKFLIEISGSQPARHLSLVRNSTVHLRN